MFQDSGHLIVSGHWSDTLRNRFWLSHNEDHMLTFLPRTFNNILCATTWFATALGACEENFQRGILNFQRSLNRVSLRDRGIFHRTVYSSFYSVGIILCLCTVRKATTRNWLVPMLLWAKKEHFYNLFSSFYTFSKCKILTFLTNVGTLLLHTVKKIKIKIVKLIFLE